VPADITSPANERIKWLVRLRERRHRDSEGVFVVEGDRLYTRALAAGLTPVVTFVVPGNDIETRGTTITVAEPAMDRASYRKRSEGIIAVFPHTETRLAALRPPDEAMLLVVEAIEKPGNLGAMLRTAAAAGASGVVATGGDVDAHNPNVARASTGALFTVPLAVADWDELEPWLRSSGTRIICATPSSPNGMWDTDLTGRLALVLGTEDEGVSERAMALADTTVSIPQAAGQVDSLNVSVAAGILLFEARRQRS
jgi:TrmH family RNA methyltransferase